MKAKIDKLQVDIKKLTKDNELLLRRLEIAENNKGKIE